MDLKLQAKQTQVLSQRMIQSAEILQMTSQELSTYINDLALENPVIDLSEAAWGGQQRESIEQQQWLTSFNEENYYLYQRQNNDDDYDFKNSWNISTDQERPCRIFYGPSWCRRIFQPRSRIFSALCWSPWIVRDI